MIRMIHHAYAKTTRSRFGHYWSLIVLLGLCTPSWAGEFPSKVVCEGKYPSHLQGVCLDDEGNIFWSFTTWLVKTDPHGKLIQKIPAISHHGDLCFTAGKVYVAVNLGAFNDPNGNADSWVYVYDAKNLKEAARHEVQEVKYGAGGIATNGKGFIVVGGLPTEIDENYLYEYDSDFNFVKTVTLESGHTTLGIQGATCAGGKWWFACYGQQLLTATADFDMKGQYTLECGYGIVALGNDQFYIARGDHEKKSGHSGYLLRAVPDEKTGLRVAEPQAQSITVPDRFAVPDGFAVELAAGPPLVKHPTFATFDDRGRLFVCENAGVNMSAEELEENLPNSIRLLEDTDDDGRFDKSTLFADKMTFPMGGAWHDGALYVASPPNIWRLEDTTGDGVADRREVIVNSFGYTGNAASIHGCFFGPGGRLYWCDGYHGHEFKDAAGNITSKREGSYIFSCKSDGSDARIHCGGGMDNPVEVDFTDEGEVLGAVNIMYTRPRVDCLVHWLYGGAYPHREQVRQELKVTGDLLGPVHRFGHVAVSGSMRYRSGALDPSWRDSQFITYFNSGKVVRLEMERDGATFRATQREFFTSLSRDFHPTDVVEDADGSLLVVDTGGWFYRGCPTSQHAKPNIQGAIYRVRRTGIVAPVDPWGMRVDWPKQTERQLTTLLDDTRFKVRERAIAECAARGESIVPALQEALQQSGLRQRRGAVWALTRIVGQSVNPSGKQTIASAAIRQALDDPHPSVRLTACRSLSTYPDLASQDQLLDRLRTDEPPIRREAATALGRIGDAKSVPALLAALGREIDRTEEHGIVYALIEINDPAATRLGLSTKNPSTQRGALIALDQMDAGNLTADDVAPLVETDDVALQQAAAEVFSRHASWSKRAAEVLARLLTLQGAVEQKSMPIRRLTTTFLAEPTVGKLIGSVLNDTDTTRPKRDLLLAAIAGGRAVPLHENWDKAFDRLLDADDPQTLTRTLSAVAAIKTDRFRGRLERLGSDTSHPPLLRVTALQIASGEHGSLTDGAFDLLVSLLDGSIDGGSPSGSLQAAQKIGASALGKSQLLRLAPKLADATPPQLHELVRPFQRSSDIEVARAFLTAMEDARSLTSLAPHEFSDVILHYPRELLSPANELLERIRHEEQQKISRLDKLLPLLSKGDATRGRKIFFAEKSQCATCHRVGDKGGKIGPDLTTIGGNRAARDLLESIVLPSATLVRDYEPYTVETADGRVLSGLIARETADTIVIQQQTGDPVSLARVDVEELEASKVSIMPNGLEKALSESDLADVIAFLKSLQ